MRRFGRLARKHLPSMYRANVKDQVRLINYRDYVRTVQMKCTVLPRDRAEKAKSILEIKRLYNSQVFLIDVLELILLFILLECISRIRLKIYSFSLFVNFRNN